MFAVSVASAYVVSPTRDYPADHPSQPELWDFSNFFGADPNRAVALMPKYNAHFVPVKYSGRVHGVAGGGAAAGHGLSGGGGGSGCK